jgi:hypothetical protein
MEYLQRFPNHDHNMTVLRGMAVGTEDTEENCPEIEAIWEVRHLQLASIPSTGADPHCSVTTRRPQHCKTYSVNFRTVFLKKCGPSIPTKFETIRTSNTFQKRQFTIGRILSRVVPKSFREGLETSRTPFPNSSTHTSGSRVGRFPPAGRETPTW